LAVGLYKEELVGLHQFLVYTCRFLEDNGASKGYFKEYVSLNISPHHIHKRKAEHKHAIIVLSKCVSQALAEHNIVPAGLAGRFEELAQKCREDVH